MTTPQTHRAREILQAVGRAYPNAWQQVDLLQAARGREVPDWPRWCYLPLHAAYTITGFNTGERRVPIDRINHVPVIGTLAAWRMGQQIIRYDQTLYESLIETPIAAELPVELLYRLPAWCLYVETPGLVWGNRVLHGFFVSLDWDERGHNELRIFPDNLEKIESVLDFKSGILPCPLILGTGTVADALVRVADFGKQNAKKAGINLDLIGDANEQAELLSKKLSPLISLVLYLCSDTADWGQDSPKNPQMVKTKKGLRIFPASQPRVWDVGVRIGAEIRSAQSSSQELAEPAGYHAGPRPHLRRAHWHTYLTGAARRKRVLKWLHPILVKTDIPEDLPATIRNVEG